MSGNKNFKDKESSATAYENEKAFSPAMVRVLHSALPGLLASHTAE
jgi:hypothetical protein